MRQYLNFVRKEFYHILRDRRTMLILLGMPIVQILIFGFAISTEVKNARLVVYDLSKSDETTKIVEALDRSGYFTLTQNLTSYDQIEPFLRSFKADIALVIPADFQRDALSADGAQLGLVVDATDPNTATTLSNYVSSIVATLYPPELGMRIVPNVKLLYNPGMQGSYNFVPGVMGLILTLLCAMMTSIAIVREKERGTMEVLLVSPMKPLIIILAKAAPYFVLSVVNLITILLLSYYVLDVPIMGELWLLILLCFTFILVCLALGLLISTLVASQIAAMIISGMVLMMPTIILSGMMFPIESMPAILRWVSYIIPTRWFIEAVRAVMIQGAGFQAIWQQWLILGVMAVVITTISLKKFKIRL